MELEIEVPLLVFVDEDGLIKQQNELYGRDQNILKRQREIELKLAYFRKVTEQYPPPEGSKEEEDPTQGTTKRVAYTESTDASAKKKRTFRKVFESKISADMPGQRLRQTSNCGTIQVLFEEEKKPSKKEAPTPNARDEVRVKLGLRFQSLHKVTQEGL